MIAYNDVVPPVEQRMCYCRQHAEKEAAYVVEAASVVDHAAYVVGIETKNELYFVHDIDVAVVRGATVVVAAIGYCRRTLQSSFHPQHNILFDVVGIDDYIAAADAVSL